jgi:hypothetical protein
MLWFICKQKGHRWKTHSRGFEMAYWSCKRWWCKATHKAPWYRHYQEMNGYQSPLHPID